MRESCGQVRGHGHRREDRVALVLERVDNSDGANRGFPDALPERDY